MGCVAHVSRVSETKPFGGQFLGGENQLTKVHMDALSHTISNRPAFRAQYLVGTVVACLFVCLFSCYKVKNPKQSRSWDYKLLSVSSVFFDFVYPDCLLHVRLQFLPFGSWQPIYLPSTLPSLS